MNLDSGIINIDLAGFPMPAFVNLEVPGYLLYSENDPHADVDYSEKYGNALGLDKINLGTRGHINSDSCLGDWDEGAMYLNRLLQTIRTLEAVHT